MKQRVTNTESSEPSKFTTSPYSPARATGGVSKRIGLAGLPNPKRQHINFPATGPGMRIEPPGQIIDPKYRWATTETILARLKKRPLLPENKDLIERFILDARLGKTIKKGAKKRVEGLRQAKYVHDLAKLDAFFLKPLNAITQEDMERFILALEDGQLKQKSGKPYAVETQVAIKKIVIKFYKWLNGGTLPPLVDWIDTSFKLPDYQALRQEEVEKIVYILSGPIAEYTIRNRAIVMVLFDSGARADELLNIRIRHLEQKDGEYWVRIEHSKTKPRTIALPFCKETLDAWLDVHPMREQQEAQLFPMRHDSLGNCIKRAGACIGKHLTPHGLRHSSATYWAARLTPYQLAYRFGWSMASKQPARYIDRAGVDQHKVMQIAQGETATALKEQNHELHRRLAMMEEQFNRLLQGDIEEVKRIIKIVSERTP